ncbi:MAG: ABC transporter permease [Chloroflexota bacterium]|nr:ABC transporter permease [Chloroflexota bacterium]MDQ6905668.1 ABC transporter permease [Chloroflexota bacterium]
MAQINVAVPDADVALREQPPAPITVLSVPPKSRGGGGVPLTESVRSSIHSLNANKMRTLLTMLGIIIGVGAVIALLAIGNGVVATAREKLEANGTNLITVKGANQVSAGVATGSTQNTLTVEDATALAEPGTLPDVAALSPEVGRGGRMNVGTVNTFGETLGVWPSYQDVHSYATVSGAFISNQDVTSTTRVVDLGANIAIALFPSTDPIGKMVRLNGIAFTVIGVMEAKGGNGFGSRDNQVYVPITAVLTLFTGNRQQPTGAGHTIETISIKAMTPESVDKAIAETNDALAARHRTRSGAPDWQVTNQADQIKAAEETQKTYQIFLLVIASISLLVGGIGIMNIMLVSVTERTREIGIRKAIGAKGKDILTQFVTEAVLISLLGALTGVIFGLLAAVIVGKTWQRTIVSPQSVFIAVFFACATGLFFGVYPARRASRLKPIDALRYE